MKTFSGIKKDISKSAALLFPYLSAEDSLQRNKIAMAEALCRMHPGSQVTIEEDVDGESVFTISYPDAITWTAEITK